MEIPLIDDMAVELDELFLGYIEIVNAVDIGTIVLGRHTIGLKITESDGGKEVKLTYYKYNTYHTVVMSYAKTIIISECIVVYSLYSGCT